MMASSTKTWLKLTRRMGRDGNPLRRRSDLIEPWLLPMVVAAFLVLCPLVGTVTSMWVRADNAAAQRAELSWHPVQAVLLQAAPGPEMSDNGANTWVVSTLARWTVNGQLHIGHVPAPAGSRAGRAEAVWLDRAGRLQPPPLTMAEVGDRVLEDTLVALAVLAVLLAGLALLVQRALDRRRLASWDTAWLAVAPRWSSQA